MTSDAFGSHPGDSADPTEVIGPGVLLANRYRVGHAVGRGGMATVYRGYDELLDRTVAVKVLGMLAANATGSREEFLREARASAALSHPNIVSVYDAGVHAGERFIVMEFVSGGSVADLIQEHAPLPATQAVPIATQVADALDYGHQHGVVHCDVKPQNVLLDESHRPKLVDFGIARTIAATGALTDTITGTAGYIAPEQLVGEKVDGRTDIYALGCVLYEMLSGDLPFDSTNLAALATQRLVRPPVPLRTRNPRVPRALAECVMRAIERDPALRFPTAGAFSRALHASTAGIAPPPPPHPIHPVYPSHGRTVELTRRPTSELLLERSQIVAPANRGNRLLWPVALVALGLLIVAGAIAAAKLPSLSKASGAATVSVPAVTDQLLSDASVQLRAQNLNVNVIYQDTTARGICEGKVMSQSPGASAKLQAGQSVDLVVSSNDQC